MTCAPVRERRRHLNALISTVVAICLALTGLTMQSASAAGTGSITGRVFTQAVGGSPVPTEYGFIYLYRADTIDGSYIRADADPDTDSEGFSFDGSTFTLSGLSAGFYKFEMAGVGVDGYQREYYNNAESLSGADPIQVGTGAVAVNDMVIEPAGQISGRVTDRAGKPLANASVAFDDSDRGGSASATTDANGNFTSQKTDVGFGTGLVKGDYRVSAHLYDYTNPDAPSYEQRYWQDSSTYDGATPVTVTPGQTSGQINIVLDEAPRVRLTVKDPAGNPLPNINVGIWMFYDGAWGPYRAGPNTTDDAGVYRKTVRIGERYKFFITPPQGVSGVTEWYDNAYSEATAREIEATKYGDVFDFEIKLGPAPAVTGSTPTVSGIAQVGQTLTAAPGTWGPAGVALTYQWLAGDAPIAGATSTTYQPTAAQIGKTISVRVTGTRAGNTATSKTSAPTAAVLAAPGTPAVITGSVPKISGTPRAGSSLIVAPGTWSPSAATLTYRWFASGRQIPGASARWFTPSNAQAGKTITVAVTGTLDGSAPVTRSSAATKAVVGVLALSKVSISGTAKVGKTLRAKTKDWAPKPIKLSYRWYRNGKTISGQTKATYRLRKADKGKRITVRITQKKAGYASASKLSSRTAKVKK